MEPDYETYSLSELLKARNLINERAYPDRAKLIKRLIEGKRKYSTFELRLLASIIDGIVISLVETGESILISMSSFATGRFLSEIFNFDIYVYSILLHGMYGQTIGKMLVGVKVLSYPTENPINLKQAIQRDIVPIVFMLILYLPRYFFPGAENEKMPSYLNVILRLLVWIPVIWYLAEIITMVFDKKCRALHDFIAGTVVVRT